MSASVGGRGTEGPNGAAFDLATQFLSEDRGERVAFRQINKKSGNRLRQQLVDDETREPVEAADKGRGHEYAKGSYLMIEDHELDAIEIESHRTIEIDTFVPRAEIDERFLDSRTSPSARRLSRSSGRAPSVL
jgi:non-homologous end joining protein Ku